MLHIALPTNVLITSVFILQVCGLFPLTATGMPAGNPACRDFILRFLPAVRQMHDLKKGKPFTNVSVICLAIPFLFKSTKGRQTQYMFTAYCCGLTSLLMTISFPYFRTRPRVSSSAPRASRATSWRTRTSTDPPSVRPIIDSNRTKVSRPWSVTELWRKAKSCWQASSTGKSPAPCPQNGRQHVSLSPPNCQK